MPGIGSDNETSVDHIDDSSSDALSEEGATDKDRRLAKMAKAIRTIIEVGREATHLILSSACLPACLSAFYLPCHNSHYAL